MIDYFLTALSLMLVIEGILPFVNPEASRKLYMKMLETDNESLRMSGFSMMLIGLIILYIVH